MKVGIDIVEIDRFEKINKTQFFSKYFTDYERDYSIKKGMQSMAGIFSCKEAILKAYGKGIGNGIALKDISIKHDNFGKPYVEENEILKKIKKECNVNYCEISISHTKNIAQSICILI